MTTFDDQEGKSMAGASDFDFLLGTWTIHNRRRTNPFEKEGVWEEFLATQTGEKYLDGRVQIEFFAGETLPGGEVYKGLTIRTFDEHSQQWFLRWLDNRDPHDFNPLVGAFQDGIGLFYQEITSPITGQPVRLRFTWDHVGEGTPRGQQAFSYDQGETWDTVWIAELTRPGDLSGTGA
ncbi:MAG TPA: DUF1579 domain-containing protein [Ktedonobacteraceae bacterium]|nr:DUF1579 domain-containing protein [Ktedonobacteraceae bacterium]